MGDTPAFSAPDQRAPWLDFFLACAQQVSPSFRIGNPPKMTYVPIQLENGTRNAISVWLDDRGVKAAFQVEEALEFEAALRQSALPWDYQEHPHHHLNIFLPAQPDDLLRTLLRPIATRAAERAISGRAKD